MNQLRCYLNDWKIAFLGKKVISSFKILETLLKSYKKSTFFCQKTFNSCWEVSWKFQFLKWKRFKTFQHFETCKLPSNKLLTQLCSFYSIAMLLMRQKKKFSSNDFSGQTSSDTTTALWLKLVALNTFWERYQKFGLWKLPRHKHVCG